MKKASSILLVLIMAMVMILGLVACKPPEPEPEPEEVDPMTLLTKIVDSIGLPEGDSINFNIDAGASIGDNKYRIKFRGNILPDANDIQIAFDITTTDDKNIVGLYLVNGKVFVKAMDVNFYLENLDMNYIIGILQKVIPNFDAILSNLVGSLVPGMEMKLTDLLDMVVPLLFDSAEINTEGDTEYFSIPIKLNDVLGLVLGLVSELNLEATLAGAGIVLPEFLPDGTPNTGISGFLNELQIPVMNIALSATIINGKNESISLQVADENNENLFGLDMSIEVVEGVKDIGIPTNVSTYVPFGITNFALDIDFDLETKRLDVGKLVNMFTGASTLPEGTMILDVDADLYAKLKINLDIAPGANANNLILIELYKDADETHQLLGIYFIDGMLKINVSDLSSALKIPNILMTGIDITGEINKLTDMLQKVIADGLDSMIPNNSGEASSSYIDNDREDFVVATQITSDGSVIISPSVTSFVDRLTGIFGFQEFIRVEGNAISIIVNAEFFNALNSLVPSLGLSIPDFGEVRLDVNLSDKGIDNVNLGVNMPEYNVIGNLNLNNFLVGFKADNLREDILAKTEGVEYATDIKYLLENILDGIKLRANLDIKIPKGDFDISSILNKFLEGIPPIKINFSNDVILKTELVFQLQYNEDEPYRSQLLLELNLIESNENVFPYLKQGKLFGLYSVDGVVYADLSNIKIANLSLPKLKLDIDLISMLAKEIDKLDINFVLQDIIDMINGNKSPIKNNTSPRYNSAYTQRDDSSLGNNEILVGLNETTFKIHATAIALTNLLASFGIDMELPDFVLDITATDINDIKISFDLVNYLTIDAGINEFVIGEKDNNFQVIIDDKEEYENNIFEAIKNIISHIDISGKLSIETSETILNLTEIINNALASSGQRFNIPIKIDIDDLKEALNIKIKWNLNFNNAEKSEILLEIYSNAYDATKKGLFIGAYYKDGNMYVDLSQLGFMRFKLERFDIIQVLNNLLSAIDTDSLDLNKIIGNLLPNTTKNASGADFLSMMASDSDMTALLNNPKNQGSISDELINLILTSLALQDNNISANVTSELLKGLLNNFGIDLGIEMSANLNIDWYNGSLKLEGQFDETKVGAELNINNIGVDKPIDWSAYENDTYSYFYDFADWSATTTLDLLTNIFTKSMPSEDPAASSGMAPYEKILWMELKNNNHARPNGLYSKLTVYRVKQRVTYHNYNCPPGSLLIELQRDLRVATSDTYIIYAILDIQNGKMAIRADKGLFNTMGINGTLLDNFLPTFDVDLVGILDGLLKPVIGEIPQIPENNQNKAEVMNADTDGGLDINTLFKDITIKLQNNNQTVVNIDMEGKALSDMLENLLSDLFYNLTMEINEITIGPARITYDPENSGKFFDELWYNFVKPLIVNAIGGAGGNIVGSIIDVDVKRQIKDVVDMFLPLPRFDNLTAEVKLIDGMASNIEVNAWLSTNPDNRRLKAKIYNNNITNTVDWGDLPTLINYNPYNGEDLMANFKPRMAHKADFTKDNLNVNSDSSKYAFMNITYGGAYNTLRNMNGNYTPGTYIVTATAYGVTKDITVNIAPKKTIKSIRDVIVTEYGSLPDKVVAVFDDGTEEIIHNINITGAEKSAEDKYNAVTKNGNVIIDGKTYDVKVSYLNGKVTTYEGNIYTSAYEKNTFVSNLPERIYFAYEGGYYRSMPVDWDLSNTKYHDSEADVEYGMEGITDAIWTSGRDKPYKIRAIINKGKSDMQSIVYNVYIRSSEVVNVKLDLDNQNFIEIDPYKYMADGMNVYPTKATIEYLDGHTDEQDIEWIFNENAPVRYTAQGGMYVAEVSNINGDYKWKQRIDVQVLSRKPKYFIFDTVDGEEITSVTINPFVYNPDNTEEFFPSRLNAKFVQGDIISVPIAWDLSNFYSVISPDGCQVNVKATVYPDNPDLKATINVFVNVLPTVVNDIVLDNGSYLIENVEKLFYGDSTLESLLPKTMKFNINNDEEAYLPVTIDIGRINANINGSESLSTVYLTCNETVYEYPVNFIIPDRSNPQIDIKEITVNYYDYQSIKDKVFPSEMEFTFGSDKVIMPVKWLTEDVDFNMGSGVGVVVIGNETTISTKSFNVNVTVENAPMIDYSNVPIALANGYETITFTRTRFMNAYNSNTLNTLFPQEWYFDTQVAQGVKFSELYWDITSIDISSNPITVRIMVGGQVQLAVFTVTIVLTD